MHEINVSSYGNRIDVLAVDRAEIIAVEIKSERDKLDRLAAQLEGMRRVAHHSIAALHEKFLTEKATNSWAAEYKRGDTHFVREMPDVVPWGCGWIFPEVNRAGLSPGLWKEPEVTLCKPLPSGALGMLWRAELREMCARFSVMVPSRATMDFMIDALRWSLSGRDLTLGVCAALRARDCVEADAPIEVREAA